MLLNILTPVLFSKITANKTITKQIRSRYFRKTFLLQVIILQSQVEIRFPFSVRFQDRNGGVQDDRPGRKRGRRQLLRSGQQAREDPDAVQHAPLHCKVSTFPDVWCTCPCQRTLNRCRGFSYRSEACGFKCAYADKYKEYLTDCSRIFPRVMDGVLVRARGRKTSSIGGDVNPPHLDFYSFLCRREKKLDLIFLFQKSMTLAEGWGIWDVGDSTFSVHCLRNIGFRTQNL